MAKKKSAAGKSQSDSAANLGFEAKLWLAADKLRNNMDAAEYKHVVLGLIFLNTFPMRSSELHERLAGRSRPRADPEDPDEYRAEGVFWVPPEARWSHLQNNAKQPTIGKLVDDAMDAIERDNQRLKGVLPEELRPAGARQAAARRADRPDRHHRPGRQGEPLQGHPGPRLRVLPVAVRSAPRARRVASSTRPAAWSACWSKCWPRTRAACSIPAAARGGMFVQSEKFVEAHGGRIGDISVYGQESNPTTWRLAQMNLAIRGIEAHLGQHTPTVSAATSTRT